MKTDIKKWREILGKVTQGGWFNANGMNILAKDKRRSCVLTQNRHGFFVSCNKEGLLDIDSAKINLEFICKARNELPSILDELEAWRKDANELQHKELDASYDNAKLRIEFKKAYKMIKEYAIKSSRLELALEKCREQRNEHFIMDSEDCLYIKELDKEISNILEGDECQ